MRVVLKLSGLSCGHCVMRVKKALEDAGAKVDEIALDQAVVEIPEDKSVEELVRAVEAARYKAEAKQ